MRPLIALLLLLIAAPVAAAKAPVATDAVSAGPTLAGSRVVWGSGRPDGSLAVRAAVPGTVRVFYRGGRIGFVAETGSGEYGLVLATRSGRAAPLARFTASRPVVGDAAWNGTYAAWASRRGRTTTIWRSGPHG